MPTNAPTEMVSKFFESIKHDKVKVRQFIAAMPKGADLHHHLTGAAYAETLFTIACEHNLFANLKTGKLYPSKPAEVETVKLAADMDDIHSVRMSLIDKWSVRNYQPYKYPLGADEYFFSLFGDFSAATNEEYLPEIVHQLKVRAKEENVQYIETMGVRPKVPEFAYLGEKDYNECTKRLTTFCQDYNKNPEGCEKEILNCLNGVLNKFKDNKLLDDDVDGYVKKCKKILGQDSSKTNSLKVKSIVRKFDTVRVADNDDDVMMKLQGYADRNKPPLDVFCQIYIVHKAMEKAPDLIVGCNLVSAENSENSMLYYKAHMIMFKALKAKFTKIDKKGVETTPNVSLHAGELTMGLIPPEHLTYHVTDAIEIAGAKRIGHGVDIAFEHIHEKNGDVNIYGNILKRMKYSFDGDGKPIPGTGIPVEINLTSNEFILGVKDDAHPFKLYKDSKVPIIISTDDPGILRTSLTEEYTLAAYRYGLSYDDLKQIVYNSVHYSFLSDIEKYGECGLKKKVDDEFENFEIYVGRYLF